MRIVLSAGDSEPVIAREYVGDEAEGEFVALSDGTVMYRHPTAGELVANLSRETFVACVGAWEQYVARVAPLKGETEQLRVVDQLRRDLDVQGSLRPGSFWALILEQAEDGLL